VEFPFPPYEKIAESLASWLGDDEAAYRASSRVEWIVTEKIHGANFCFVTDGRAIRCAKRKAFLGDDDDFFGHRALAARHSKSVLDTFARAHGEDPRVQVVFIYGELFGGGYPHPEVAPVAGMMPVQTGCWYTPGLEFSAFDVGVVHEGEAGRVYLDQDVSRRICEDVGVRYARPLFRGSYEDAFSYPLGFETKIPAELGLPSLGPSNKAEGIVLKPARAITVPRRRGLVRPVIKRKIPEFSEDERFHDAEKWATKPTPAAPSTLDWLQHEASALVNENRLQAAVSKVGRVGPEDKARLAEVATLVREDLEHELASSHKAELAALSPADAFALRRFLDDEARALVELYLG
jgi:Rnl2 family RNA ligase